jgi:hypothetical protein
VELGNKGLRILKELVEGRNLTGLNPQLITYSIPAAVMKLSKVRGGNALGLNAEGHLISKSSPSNGVLLSAMEP